MRATFILIFSALGSLAFGQTAPMTDPSTASNGLYYVSTISTGQTLEAADGSTVKIAEKSGIKILNASVFAINNANTDFLVSVSTSDFPVDATTGVMPRSVVLRIGHRAYSCTGSGGRTGMYNEMQFAVHGQEEAQTVAKGLSVNCILRRPPGYKFLAQFVPTKSEFRAGEPVLVKFSIQNLDDRTLAFLSGGSQRGYRDNQYGFRAMYNYAKPVTDTGDPVNFGGLCQMVNLQPGKTFESQVELKKWFSFVKPGAYFIHGSYALTFYQPGDGPEALSQSNLLWSNYACADFTVTVK